MARKEQDKIHRRRLPLLLISGVLVIGVILGSLAVLKMRERSESSVVPKIAGCNATVRLNEFGLEEANDLETQQKGLGGRESLPQKCGMLFSFDEATPHGIWMKDMKFNLDIMWLDQNKRIISIRENAPYNSYPEVYTPQSNAKYVIELNAGQSRAGAFRVGQVLNFESQPAAKVNKH